MAGFKTASQEQEAHAQQRSYSNNTESFSGILKLINNSLRKYKGN